MYRYRYIFDYPVTNERTKLISINYIFLLNLIIYSPGFSIAPC